MPVLGVLTTYRHLDATVSVPDLSAVDVQVDDDGVRVTARD
jgi:hypothetical protein